MWRFIQEDGIEGVRAAATDAFLSRAYARGGTMPDPTLRIFTYKPNTLVLGRFQSAAAQFRLDECKHLGMAVGRRLTGGGAALMGAHQLAVSFTTCVDHPAAPSQPSDMFTVYGNAICRGLRHFGIDCRFRPRHDFMVGNSKVGMADVRIDSAGAAIFHAHVLLDFDAHEMVRLLRLSAAMTEDRAAALLAERLTSLKREKAQAVDASTVRDFMRVSFEAGFGIEFQQFPITPLEHDGITQLEREKYATEHWLNERSPTAGMSGLTGRQTPGGLLLAFASRAGEQIGSVLLAGDFFGDSDAVEKFQASLRGVPASPESIRAAADQFVRPGALEGVDPSDIADAVLEALSAAACPEPSRRAHAPALPDQAHGLPQSFL